MPGRQTTKRFSGLPLLAGGTDIPNAAPVTIAAGKNGWIVMPVETNAVQPFGITRASAPANTAVDVQDLPDIKTALAAASIAQGAFVGVASANLVSGASGNYPVPQIAEVARASASNRWAIGVALEGAAPGNNFSYYFNPQQLSGLT